MSKKSEDPTIIHDRSGQAAEVRPNRKTTIRDFRIVRQEDHQRQMITFSLYDIFLSRSLRTKFPRQYL